MGEFVENTACPKCSKSGEGKSLSVYTDGSYCNECGHRESTNSDNSVSKPKKTGIKDITVVPFKSRGLTADTVRQYNSGGYTSSTGSYRVFNYTDESGIVYAQKFKNVEDKSDMFKLGDTRRTGLFGPRHLNPDKDRFCIACEGEEDAMAVYQATGYAAFSIPNGVDSAVKTFEAEFEYLNGWQYVVLFFDNDEAGKRAAEKASKVLPIGKARIATPTLKDANEMLLNGQKDKIKGCLWKAREIRPEGVIKGSEIDWNDIVKELPTGVDILYPGLSKAMRGLHKRRITLVTAQPKAGKSTICREIAYDLVVNKGMKVGNIFLEEDQRETVKSYVAIDNNVPHYKVWEKPLDYIDPENPPQYLNNDNIAFFNHFGSLDSKKLLDAIRYMHYVMAVDYVILDHISIVVSGMSSEQGERKDIDILMTSLRSLVQETGVGVVAVCHIKQMKDTDPVTMHSLRGSGSLAQLSDFVVGVEKALDQEGKEIQDTRTVNVLANRYTGMTGQVDILHYNRNTGRLLPISSTEGLDDDEDFTI